VSEEQGDALFEALWARALEAWDDEKVHVALLEHALRLEMLPILAGRYRALLNDDAKGAMAKKRIDALVSAATQMLFAVKTPPPQGIPWQVTAVAALISAGLLLYVGWMMFGR
jgi:hypothetical protein